MWLAAGPLACWGAWVAWTALGSGRWVVGMIAVIALVTSAGLMLLRTWARYPLYAFAAGLSLSWIHAVWQIASVGWPFTDRLRNALSLLPGACLLILCAGGAWVVHRQYRVRAR